MKIALVSPKPLSKVGGTTVRASQIADVLAARHDVSMFAPTGRQFPVVTTLLRSMRLALAILSGRIDLIYSFDDYWAFPLYFLVSRIRRCKLLFEIHGVTCEEPTPNSKSMAISQVLQEFAVRHADVVTAVGENMLRFYQRHNPSMSLVPLFADGTVFTRKSSGTAAPRRSQKRIGLVGPFDVLWGSEGLRLVYDRLENFDRRITFVIIGHCDTRVENPRLRYTGHLASLQDYASELSALDAALVYKEPARGPYTKTIEAMACGVPVFTTPIGMVGFEKATPGEDILVFPKEELVARMNGLLFDEELMARIGQRARVTVEKYYSKSAVSEKLLAIVEDLVKEKTCHKGQSR